MDLYIKVASVRAGTSDSVDARLEPCPPGVEAATVRSYLARRFGEPLRLVWTSTSRHPRVDIGWVFPGGPAAGTDAAPEILCIPALLADDGTLQDLFELQADQRQDFERLATSGASGGHQVITAPPRDSHSATTTAGSASGAPARDPADTSRPGDWQGELDRTITQIARQTGATLHRCPRHGPAGRCALLPDTADSRGSPGRSSAARGTRNSAHHRARPGSGRRRVLRPRDHLLRMDLHSASRPRASLATLA